MQDHEKSNDNVKHADISEKFPEIVGYWLDKGMPRQHIEIFSGENKDDADLYLYGRKHGSCSSPADWKLKKDLKPEEQGRKKFKM